MIVDPLLSLLHIGFAIFTIGPLTVVTMSTPRYIRGGDASVVQFLHRSTRVYGLLAIAVFAVGLGQAPGSFDQAWLSASMLLFIAGLALVFALVEPDQRRALRQLQSGQDAGASALTGRIGAVSGLTAAIWVAILVLMIWQP